MNRGMNRHSERSLLPLLAAVQFTHVLDFMILMPLGPQLMRELHIGPGRFSALVAAYTISSGVVGLLAAPFIDRFDRRKLLLFAFAGTRPVSCLFHGRSVDGLHRATHRQTCGSPRKLPRFLRPGWHGFPGDLVH